MPSDSLNRPNKVGLTGFAARASQLKSSDPQADGVIQAENRICLMPDNSSSMNISDGSSKMNIELEREALLGFIQACNFSNTAVAMYPIPMDQNVVKLTQQPALLQLVIMGLNAPGGTPMSDTMHHALRNESLTRAVLISDGEANSADRALDEARHYREAGVPIDCVHIGSSTGGEATLREIAKITGGTFIKFRDVKQFGESLKYLSPRYRALLNAPGAAKLIGADEVR